MEKEMVIVEPHIHMYSRTTNDYQAMYRAGIRACVEPSFWLGTNRRYAGTFLDYFSLILDFETVRARRFGMDHYACVAVNPKEAEDVGLAEEVLAEMGPYIDHERCVAVGEIGFNRITPNEEKVFVRQLEIARDHNKLVVIHTPHDTPEVSKLDGVRRTVAILKELGYSYDRIIIDHNTEATMAASREIPVWTGMTVYPYSKLDPKRVIGLIREHGLQRMLVNSSADWGVSDPTSLAQVADNMKTAGFADDEIKKLVFDNPMAFFSQADNFKPDLDLTPVPIIEFQR